MTTTRTSPPAATERPPRSPPCSPLPCGLACAGSVIPGLDDIVTTIVVGLAALALLALAARWVARWVRERREDAADALTAARWRAVHAPHLLTPADRTRLGIHPRRPGFGRSGGGVMWGVTGWVIRTWLRITILLALGVGAAWLWLTPGWFTFAVDRRRGRRAVDHPPTRPRMVLPSLRHLVVDPMSPRSRPTRAGRAVGPPAAAADRRGSSNAATTSTCSWVDPARSTPATWSSDRPTALLRDPSRGPSIPVPRYEAAMATS